jgi:prepilin-type N-terminal cleavage/methylation domain-containing protein
MAIARHQRGNGFLRGGFTLIEILVVVVILGIAAAIVVPAIGSRSDLKATSAARMIMADLIYAQNRSISQQKKHYVRFDKATQTYEVLEQVNPSAVLIKHPVNADNFVVKLGTSGAKPIRDVTIDTVAFDGKTILVFDELGTPLVYDATTNSDSPMNAGKITLACGTLKLTITIEPFSGELRLN